MVSPFATGHPSDRRHRRAAASLSGPQWAALRRRPHGHPSVCCQFRRWEARQTPIRLSATKNGKIPEMRKHGYSAGFAAGIIAAGGTLGILLPPSISSQPTHLSS